MGMLDCLWTNTWKGGWRLRKCHTSKYNKVVRKWRKVCRTLQKVLLSHGISSTLIGRGCPSVSQFLFSASIGLVWSEYFDRGGHICAFSV